MQPYMPLRARPLPANPYRLGSQSDIMRSMRLILFVVALVVLAAPRLADAAEPEWIHAIAMHGTPRYGPDFEHFDYVNPNAPKGGTVTIGAIGGFDTLNGFNSKGQAAGIGQIYDSLTVASADEPFTRYGLLAEAMRTPEDRSWVEFRLRAEARWHDGKPVTADDVIWTFDTLIEKGAPAYAFYYASVAGVQKLDERTVRFTFKPGENRELPLILAELAVLPKHYWEGRDFAATTLEPPLGSGPYRIDKVEAPRSFTLKRIPDYWGRNLPVNRGIDNIDEYRVEYYRDTTVAVEAFKAGAFDFRLENSSVTWATAYDIPAARDGRLKKVLIPHAQTRGMQGFAYNIRREIFKDRGVRRALAYAFDFEWSNRNLFYGQYTHSRSYFDNSELAATGLPGPEELKILGPYRGRIPEEVFTTEYNPPVTKGDGRIRANLKIADALLKEAGWVIRDKERVNAETGQPLAFEILLVSPLFERIVLPFKKNLARLGIDVSVRLVETSQYIERLRTLDFDMVVSSFGQSLSPGNEQRDYWGSASAERRDGRNIVGIKDPVIDELIENLIAAPTREDLTVRVRALDRVLQWGFYVIPNWHISSQRLLYWNKFGMPPPTELRGAILPATWWVDPEKEKALAAKGR